MHPFRRGFDFSGLFLRLEASFCVRHGLLQIGTDELCHCVDLCVVCEAEHVRVFGVRPGAFEHACGVLHQCSIEKTQPEISAQGTDDRNVALLVQVARVTPLDSFNKR